MCKYMTAISDQRPEIVYVRYNGIAIISRVQFDKFKSTARRRLLRLKLWRLARAVECD